MLSRRTFVKGMAATGALAALSPMDLIAQSTNKAIGIQLYTIRELVNKNLAGTLTKLAKIGYSTVETYGYQNGKFYDMSPRAFKNLAADSGILPLSSHSSISMGNIHQNVEDTINAGMKYLVLPSIPENRRKSLDDYKRIADELNRMGEICVDAGLTLGYHNHAYEFDVIDGQVAYNVLLDGTDPELVSMQIDTYWMVYGGHDPMDYFNAYPGRFKLWHVKDMEKGEERESTEIGYGILDFPLYFKNREKAGLEYIFVEQESFKMDPWVSLQKSFDFLKGQNF